MKKYRVSWEIDIEDEDVNTPEEAVQNCWDRLHAHNNDWIWEVKELPNGEKWEIDCEWEPWLVNPIKKDK